MSVSAMLTLAPGCSPWRVYAKLGVASRSGRHFVRDAARAGRRV